MESLQLAISNLTSPAVLAFVLGVGLVLLKSSLQIPNQIFDFLSIYLLLAIGIKGGVSLNTTPLSEVWLPALVSIGVGVVIPIAVFFSLKLLTPLSRVDRGALSAHYGSTSLVTFTAGLVFVESAGLKVEGYLPSLLAVMEVPGIVIGILLAKGLSKDGSIAAALGEIFSSKSVILLVGGILIGLASGPTGYEKVEPFFGGIFGGLLTIFLLQLGIQAGSSLKDARQAGFGLVVFSIVFPLVVGSLGVVLAHSIGLGQGGSAVFGLLCASASYIAAPAAVKLSLPEAKGGVCISASLGMTFPVNLVIGIPLLTWLAGMIAA